VTPTHASTGRVLALCALAVLALAAPAFAQGVGINATGAAADTSAILDLSANNKGFLPPRMTAAQRAAIVQPATSLVVYQTDGTSGLYYNVGTPLAPNWRLIVDSAALVAVSGWLPNGTSLYYNGGKVGMGTSAPTFRVEAVDSLNGLRVQTNTAGGTVASFGGFGAIRVDAPGVAGGRLSLLENGNLGLGVTNPTSKLSFAPSLGKKIALYSSVSGDYGIAVQSGRLQLTTDTGVGDVAFGVDAAGTFNERFALKMNGALAVNGNTGAAGQVLQSNGSGAAATWVNPSSATYNNIYTIESTTYTNVARLATTTLPDLIQTVNVAGNAKLDITVGLMTYDIGCALCNDSQVTATIVVDGTSIKQTYFNTRQDYGAGTSVSDVVSVGPGSHIVSVSVYVYSSSAGNVVRFGGNTNLSGNSLIVRVIPQ
jgi:hypothetical protein